MRHRSKVREIAAGGPRSFSHPAIAVCKPSPKSLAPKSSDSIRDLPEAQVTSIDRTRSPWVYLPKGLVQHPTEESRERTPTPRGEPESFPHKCVNGPAAAPVKESEPLHAGATLFQDSFFFCKVAGVGDVPGPVIPAWHLRKSIPRKLLSTP
jgi:hypothetical protein